MRALVSVSDKVGVVEFVQGLVDLGYEIISTGGTAKLLQQKKVPVTPIDAVTDFPEMLDGRVKTLHPKIHGGLLALRDNPQHMKTCETHGIGLIDLVVVNLYPFEQTIRKKNVGLGTAIENIDIGGPSMIRSASKNYRSVGVVVNPDRYTDVLDELKAKNGQLSLKTKELLALEAFQHTAHYDATIAAFLETRFKGEGAEYPRVMSLNLKKAADLRYGENPHQSAAFYHLTGLKGLPRAEQLHGKALSYNNLIDLQAAWEIAREFELPAVAIIKHTNPCGAAVGDSILQAYKKAHKSDPVSAFGSIVGVNRMVNAELAKEISKTFVEAVIAKGFEASALKILQEKAAIRLLKMADFDQQDDAKLYRFVDGGFLVQSRDSIEPSTLQVATTKKPTKGQLNDLKFADRIVKHVKSNAIVVVKNGQTLGVGAGQMSRVEAVEIAIKKAGDKVKGAVVGSDAFFPFKDSVESMAKAGISAIIQPGGSKRDQESIDACNDHGLSMVFTGVRHFKH